MNYNTGIFRNDYARINFQKITYVELNFIDFHFLGFRVTTFVNGFYFLY